MAAIQAAAHLAPQLVYEQRAAPPVKRIQPRAAQAGPALPEYRGTARRLAAVLRRVGEIACGCRFLSKCRHICGSIRAASAPCMECDFCSALLPTRRC